MDAVGRIEGAEKLISIFGHWPSFHDAEVVWVRLDRRPVHEDAYLPTLEASIHTFEMTNEVGPDGYFVLRHHVLVHFRFHEVDELQLEGFNCQNALFGLMISDIRDRQLERIHFEVSLQSAFGLGGSFLCHQIEVIDVSPCSKDASPLGGKTEK